MEQPQSNVYTLPIIGVIGEDFKMTDLLMHLNAAKNSQVIKVAINSPGGYIDDGLKMRDALLNSGKIIHTSNIGDVCSIAVSIFLTASKPNRVFDPSKGVFLIHNPLVDPVDIDGALRADDLTAMSKELKNFENQLVKQYNEATGANTEVLRAFMDEEKPLTPEQIESLGFATIVHPQMKAVALIKTKKQEMTEIKEIKESMSRMEKFFEKITNKWKAKNLMIQDVNGVEIDFGDAIETPEQIAVGLTATVDGSPANGDYVMADGTTYKFENGALVEIMTAQPDEEMEALKAENAELKTQLEAATLAQNKIQKDFDDFKAKANEDLSKVVNEFKAFKNQFNDFKFNPSNPDEPQKPEIRRAYKKKE